MIKSQYSDPAIQDHGFINHIHHVVKNMGVFPGTTKSLIEIYKLIMISNLPSTAGGGAKPRNLALFRKVIGDGGNLSTHTWNLLRMWKEGVDYDDSSASGSVDVHDLTGDVHVVMSFGKKNSAGQLTFQDWEDFIPRSSFAPTIVRLLSTVTQGPKGDKGDQGLQGIPGATGAAGKDGANGSGVDPRVDALISQIGAQGLQITQIETALGNIGSGEGLSQIDRKALDWVIDVMKALRIG